VRVEGLETLDYLDNLQDRARSTEQGDAIVFESEVRRQSILFIICPLSFSLLLNKTFALFTAGQNISGHTIENCHY
jgi:hypothetical protein